MISNLGDNRDLGSGDSLKICIRSPANTVNEPLGMSEGREGIKVKSRLGFHFFRVLCIDPLRE